MAFRLIAIADLLRFVILHMWQPIEASSRWAISQLGSIHLGLEVWHQPFGQVMSDIIDKVHFASAAHGLGFFGPVVAIFI